MDLPIASVMRSKYATYPEYHTSLDNFDLVTELGLQKSFDAYKRILETIEWHCYPRTRILCEPMMSKRGLRSPISQVGSATNTKTMMNLIAYSDGISSLINIADTLDLPVWDLFDTAEFLESLDILKLKFGISSGLSIN